MENQEINSNQVKMTEQKTMFSDRRGMAILAVVAIASCATMLGQDAFSQGLGSVETSFRDSWWPSIKNIAYILAAVAAVFGLVKIFQQSQRGEDNVGKVAGAWATGLAVFLIGIWAIDTFIIAAAI
jgi:hypothetical protein